jgi:hypothetical protein
MTTETISFDEIKKDITSEYDIIKNIPYLEPYLDPILSLNSVDDNYFLDSGKSICAYFLSNSSKWKTEKSKSVKKALKKLI